MSSADQTIKVRLRFYGDLNDWLTINSKDKIVERVLPAPTSVKDLIESCGIPHTEVDLILVDGNSVDFSFFIQAEVRVSVYPFFNFLEIPKSKRLQRKNIRPIRFLADVNLGKLAKYLLLAGFDTAYHNDIEDKELIEQMLEEERILLTRDRKLLMYKAVQHGYLPRSDDPALQFEEVMIRFNLKNQTKPFVRCPNCNGVLESVPKSEILEQLEPLTKKYHEKFSRCVNCNQIYWAGSHRKRLNPKVRALLSIQGKGNPEFSSNK